MRKATFFRKKFLLSAWMHSKSELLLKKAGFKKNPAFKNSSLIFGHYHRFKVPEPGMCHVPS